MKKQKASDLNVDRENHKRVKYDYKINDLILLDRGTYMLVPASCLGRFTSVMR